MRENGLYSESKSNRLMKIVVTLLNKKRKKTSSGVIFLARLSRGEDN